jgi:CRP/FNR family transcriptional regulator
MNLDSSAFIADQELIRALRERADSVDCAHERFLFRQGDEPTGLYLVLNGEVTITMESPAGNEVVSMRAEPGSLLGLPGLVGNQPYSLSAFASRDAEVSFVSRAAFSQLMLSEPNLAILILRVLANEVRTARLAITGK